MLSYNIAAGRRSDLETLAEVIGSASPDIAGLQELDRFTNRSGIEVDQASVLGELTGMQSYFVKTIDWDGGDFGMAVLLADGLTLVGSEAEALPLPEGGEERVAWRIELVRDGDPSAPFNVLVTHLSPYSNANREAQAQVLVEGSLPMPELVLGDLNAGPQSAPLQILAERFLAGPTTGSDQIDYVLHEAEAGWQLQELRELDAQDHPQAASASDHPAVLATFEN